MKSYLFVGVDTHKDSHTAAVLDDYFKIVATISFDNNRSGFTRFERRLKELSNGKSLLFGLEDSQGLGSFLASYLTSKGYEALEINPVTTDRGRKHTVSRDKSDERDAVIITKTLIRERTCLHPVRIDRNSIAIREVIGYRQMLVGESTRIKNRLHMVLFNQYKKVLGCFKDPFRKCALAFFKRYPHPSSLKEADPDSLSKFLKANSNGMFSEKKARAILSSADSSDMADTLTDARAHIITAHIERLTFIGKELKKIQDILTGLVKASSYHSLTSIPGIDIVTAARIISSVADISRFSSASKLARFCGIAPSERSTGRKRRYEKSKYGNKSLRSAIYFVALSHISRTRDGMDKNPVSRTYYLKKISEGKTKKEALTCLTRRLVDIIFAVMRDRSIYNFSKGKFTKHPDAKLNTSAA